MEALLVGLLRILLFIVIIMIVVMVFYAVLRWLEIPVPEIVKRLVMAAIAIVALILIIQLLFGGVVILPFR